MSDGDKYYKKKKLDEAKGKRRIGWAVGHLSRDREEKKEQAMGPP